MDLEAAWAAGRLREGLNWCLEHLGRSSDGLYARYALEFALELGDETALVQLSKLDHPDPEFQALQSHLLVRRGRLPEALQTAQSAYQQRPGFLTAYALGSTVALRSTREAEGWFREALRLAEGQGWLHRAAQAAAALAMLQLQMGQYSQAEAWAAWGLRLAEKIGLNKPFVHNTLLAAQGYAQTLTAQLETLPPLELTQPDAALLQGDFLLALGQSQEALQTYNLLDERLSPDRFLRLPLLARKVRALLALGQLEAALQLGQYALTLSEDTPAVFREWGELAYLLPIALLHPSKAVERLPDLLQRLRLRPSAPRSSMAALYMARVYLGLGWETKARSLLLEASELDALSPAGRAFLAKPPEMFEAVFALVQPVAPLRLHLLGRPCVWQGTQQVQLGPRQQEILAALASRPEGMNAEQLALWVWGEAGKPEVARAEVRRLRQKLPLQGNPYRLPSGTWADFLEVRQRLLQQDLEGALALYSGPLLPGSEATGVVEAREEVWSLLKTALHH